MKKANLESDLDKLNAMLPYGSHVKIAKKTGYNRVTVSGVLNGTHELNDANISIVQAAQKIVEDYQKAKNSTLTKLNEFLSKTKA